MWETDPVDSIITVGPSLLKWMGEKIEACTLSKDGKSKSDLEGNFFGGKKPSWKPQSER